MEDLRDAFGSLVVSGTICQNLIRKSLKAKVSVTHVIKTIWLWFGGE